MYGGVCCGLAGKRQSTASEMAEEETRDEQAETPYTATTGGGRASAGSLRGRRRRQILQYSTAFYTNTGVEWLTD